MIRRFLNDIRGNYVVLTAVAMVPIMGGLALAVDYTELSRQRAATMNALDAAGIATATAHRRGRDRGGRSRPTPRISSRLISVPVDPGRHHADRYLPNNNYGGGTLKLTANLTYEPMFLPTAAMLINKVSASPERRFHGRSRNPPEEHARSRAGPRQFRIDGRVRHRHQRQAHRPAEGGRQGTGRNAGASRRRR